MVSIITLTRRQIHSLISSNTCCQFIPHVIYKLVQVISGCLNGFVTQLALTYLSPPTAGVDVDTLEPGELLAANIMRHARFHPCSLPPTLPVRPPLRFIALASKSAAAATQEEAEGIGVTRDRGQRTSHHWA
jgi:hypothetical protein